MQKTTLLLIYTCLLFAEDPMQLYEQGKYKKFLIQAEKDCTQNNSGACYMAGVIYRNGATDKDGVKIDQNYNKAFDLFTKSSNMNNPEGKNALGEMYYRGQATSVNQYKAFRLISEACQQNLPIACESQAYLLEQGHGTTKNLPNAYGLYQQACKMGLNSSCGHANRMKMDTEQSYQREQLAIQQRQIEEQNRQMDIQRKQMEQQRQDMLIQQMQQQNQFQSQQNANYLQNLQRRMGY